MNSATTRIRGRSTTPLLPIIFLMMCSVFSTTKAQTQGRYWEVLTLFGGKGDETFISDMVYDAKRDRIIIVGGTQERDLPVTQNAIKTRFTDMMDGYIAVFNGDCSELVYCSYLGGTENDAAVSSVILDEDRLFLVVGGYSHELPTTGTAWSATVPGHFEATPWFAVISLDSFEIFDAGYFGGNDRTTTGSAIKMWNGDLAITGSASSTNLPVTSDAFQRRKLGHPDYTDAWIAIFDSTLALTFCSYHGGAGYYDNADGALTETEDYIVFSGTTWSPDLPVTDNAYQKTFADGGRGWCDAYMTIISKEDKRNVYTTYLGGTDDDFIADIIATRDERIVLLGYTRSPDFPATPGAWQTAVNDTSGSRAGDIIVAVFSLRDMRFEHITYIGGHLVDWASSGIYDAERNVVRILAKSSSFEFPFLEPKASTNSSRGMLLDFDVSRGVPISAIPVVDFRNSSMRSIIKTETGRLLLCGSMEHFPQVEPIPVKPTGYKTVLTGVGDIFIGEIHNNPVSVEMLSEPSRSDGDLRVLNNPARNELRFVVEGAVPEASRAQLYDMLGRRVADAPLLYNGRSAHGSIQLHGLVPGMYILTVPGPAGVRTAKVLVAK